MASKSILKTFWPVLKVLQLLGACPIQKDEDSTFGFKAFTFRVYLTIVLFTWLVLGGFQLLDLIITELKSHMT